MGMNQFVRFPLDKTPSWSAVRDLLATHKLPLQIRMIDGELAFPDEEPADSWRELRLATQAGQPITLKRTNNQVELVVWGNADQTLGQAWNALTWAFAEAGHGMILSAQGEQTPSQYLNSVDLPPILRNSRPDDGGMTSTR